MPGRRIVVGLATGLLLAAGLTAAPPAGGSAETSTEERSLDGCRTGEGEVPTDRVAVVVAFPSHLFTQCVAPGGSGLDVLARTDLELYIETFGSRGGAVCGLRDPGRDVEVGCRPGACLTCAAPDYWVYAPCYRYSQLGAGATRPAGGTVEAWRWDSTTTWDRERPVACDDGQSEPPPPPPPPPPTTAAPTTAPPGTGTASPGGGTGVDGGTPAPSAPGPPGSGPAGTDPPDRPDPPESPGGSGGPDRPDDANGPEDGTAPDVTAPAAPGDGDEPGATTSPEATPSTTAPTTTTTGPTTTGPTTAPPAGGSTSEADADDAAKTAGSGADRDERADGAPPAGSVSVRDDGGDGGGGALVPVAGTGAIVAALGALALRARRRREAAPS